MIIISNYYLKIIIISNRYFKYESIISNITLSQAKIYWRSLDIFEAWPKEPFFKGVFAIKNALPQVTRRTLGKGRPWHENRYKSCLERWEN